MRQLHVLGVSDDGDTLLLGTSAKGKVTHQLSLDARLRQAVRGQLSAPGADRAESVLSPKEIQARLRAGATPDEVAKVARVPVARVLPYFAPVEAERERIVEEARRAVLHRPRGPQPTQPLGSIVDARLREVAGLKDDSVAWTARRRADGAWVVRLSYAARGGARRAEWLWQPVSRELTALDSSATRLATGAAAPKRKPVRRPAAAQKAGSRKKSPAKKTSPAARPAAKKASTAKSASAAKQASAAKKASAAKRAAAARPAAAATKAVAAKASGAAKRPAVSKKRAATKAAAPTPLPRPAKPALRRTKPAPAPRPRVLEVVPDPIPAPLVEVEPVEAAPEVVEVVAPAAVAAPARRPGARVPVPSWSDVLLGVTGPVTTEPAPDTGRPDMGEPATPRTSSGGRRRRT